MTRSFHRLSCKSGVFFVLVTLATLAGACAQDSRKQTAAETTLSAATLKSRKSSANPCIVFGAQNEAGRKPRKVVDPLKEPLSALENDLVFAAVLSSNLNGTVTSLTDALSAFKDVDGQGTNAGQISYFDIVVKGQPVTVAQVTYFPGENEYGALFRYNSGSSGFDFASLLGLVQDGSLSCLVFQN